MSTTIHCCLDIRGALRWPLRRLRGMFRTDGRVCSGAEAREILFDHLSQGRRVLPMGESCPAFAALERHELAALGGGA